MKDKVWGFSHMGSSWQQKLPHILPIRWSSIEQQPNIVVFEEESFLELSIFFQTTFLHVIFPALKLYYNIRYWHIFVLWLLRHTASFQRCLGHSRHRFVHKNLLIFYFFTYSEQEKKAPWKYIWLCQKYILSFKKKGRRQTGRNMPKKYALLFY